MHVVVQILDGSLPQMRIKALWVYDRGRYTRHGCQSRILEVIEKLSGGKMKKVLLILASTLALTACKTVQIENGEVPDEYLARAKKLEGVYAGSFEGRPAELKITFEGNRPVLTYKDNRGESLLLPECHAAINNLKWVYVANKGVVDSVGFYFDPGLCAVDGREVVLSFTKDYNTIRLSLLQRRVYERNCRWEVSDPRTGPREICEINQRDINMNGKFSR